MCFCLKTGLLLETAIRTNLETFDIGTRALEEQQNDGELATIIEQKDSELPKEEVRQKGGDANFLYQWLSDTGSPTADKYVCGAQEVGNSSTSTTLASRLV